MPLEDGAQQVVLSCARGVNWEPLRSRCPVRIADHSLRVVPQTIHPVVPDAIAELLTQQTGSERGAEQLLR